MNAPSTTWVENAVKAAGRAEGSGNDHFDLSTGTFGNGIDKVKRNTRGTLPPINDLDQLKYLANLGYIDAHQDMTTFAALSHYLDAPDAFYIGVGLMKHWISPAQINTIRDLLADDIQKRAFDAAIALHIGRVGSPIVTPKSTVFGCDGCSEFGADAGDAQQAATVSGKLGDGDYGGAAAATGGAIAEGAAVGTSVALMTTAAGAAIGTAVPIPVVGTAAGAAIGAAVGGAIVLGHVIFDQKPQFTESDWNRMRQRCDDGGGNHGTGVRSDNYGGCKYPDKSVSGGDWPFPGTWNHEIRDDKAYRNAWNATCAKNGGVAFYPGPNLRGTCVFPDGFSTDGGEFWAPEWPAEARAWWEADQAARKLQYQNLGSYLNGLKQIDIMFSAADKAMRQKGASTAARNTWFKKIGEAFAKIYESTGQTKYAPLNVAAFLNDPANQRRVFSPSSVKVAPMPKGVTPHKYVGLMITRGLLPMAPAQKAAVAQPLVADTAHPDTKEGVRTSIETVKAAKKGVIRKVLEFLHLLKRT